MSRIKTLIKLVRDNNWTRGAELGVWQGELLNALMAESSPDLTMIAVDTWEPTFSAVKKDIETGETDLSGKDMEAAKRMVNLIVRAYEPRIQVIQLDTVAAAAYVPDESLDFVFVDADHRTASVLRDIDAWKPKLKPSGWMTGHDLHWPSVKRAVDERLPGWREYPGNVWAREKIPCSR